MEAKIKLLIGKLKYCIDIWDFKIKKARSYISRLEETYSKDINEKTYEKTQKRNKYLLEEIGNFMDISVERSNTDEH